MYQTSINTSIGFVNLTPMSRLKNSQHQIFCLAGPPYLSTFRNFHGGDSARIDVFDPFF